MKIAIAIIAVAGAIGGVIIALFLAPLIRDHDDDLALILKNEEQLYRVLRERPCD